jgi:uncharacterized membrane protein YbhN (UPF0104 family)
MPVRSAAFAHLARLLGSRVARIAFLAAVLALAGLAVADRWAQVRGALVELPLWSPVAAFGGVLVGAVGTFACWRALLGQLGSPLPVRAASRVFFLGQLGKYLPGSLWPVLAQIELGRQRAVPPRRSAAAFVLTVLISLASALILAAVTLPLLAGPTTSSYRWLFLLAPVLLGCLHPRVLGPALARVARLTGRPAPERPLRVSGVAVACGWALLSWLGFGVQVWMLAAGLSAPLWRAAPLAFGGFALAWSVGFLVVFVPAGAGVREAALTAALAPVLNPGAALLVALCSRLLMTLADIGCAAVAGAVGRPGREALAPAGARSPAAEPGTDG